MYEYHKEKPKIFTEEGQLLFIKIRDHIASIMPKSGAMRMDAILGVVAGDSFLQMACVDRMVEIGELVEVNQDRERPGQHRIFVKRT